MLKKSYHIYSKKRFYVYANYNKENQQKFSLKT